jgi:energy-coupling factor transporter ATP-binding protein EcfA2
MPKDEQKPMTRAELLAIIEQARRENWEVLDLCDKGIAELPPEIGQLKKLKKLMLFQNKLTQLPDEIGQLISLQELELSYNQLTAPPESIGQLTSLQRLSLHNNQLTALPESIGQLRNLTTLVIHNNNFSELNVAIGNLKQLRKFYFGYDARVITGIMVEPLSFPNFIRQFSDLKVLAFGGLNIASLPDWLFEFRNLESLSVNNCKLINLQNKIEKLSNLKTLSIEGNKIAALPFSIARLEKLEKLQLDDNPLNPALKSAYDQGLPALMAYLRSLEQAEPLYETKLVLVGEGGVGKTTLLKALTGKEPKQNEPTTHGVSIDIHSMHLPHPEKQGVNIQFNAWDFGGQEVYRVTHQFFFSKRSVYLLVWEPRMGVQQCQVEDWLKLIRLRVGDNAKVIIVSTHAKTGERIARIDQPVFRRDYGSMIVDFIEVDSLEPDPQNKNEKFGLAALKQLIANAAQKLEHMGMDFGKAWKEARDELIELGQTQPHVAYAQFAAVCEKHGLESIGTRTLAGIMHDLGYIVYYGDDERLRGDVVLQPEWLTKAIGFVLEDRKTQEMDGILPDNRLREVLFDHPFKNEPKYPTELYPFFLRLMEKYDVSYRLESGEASLVAQHVPQVRPALPWQPEEAHHPDRRRIAMVCVMEESPPGLVPWMIVRTHDYVYEDRRAEGKPHRLKSPYGLHWQKGMFLRNKNHG